jgi:hypothetical protein
MGHYKNRFWVLGSGFWINNKTKTQNLKPRTQNLLFEEVGYDQGSD